MSIPLEDYALIGDGETAALVNRYGGIDWLCWPRFDSEACFAALLGGAENGSWTITSKAHVIRRERRYQHDTLVMETDFHTEAGGVRLIDFMPRRQGSSSLVRIVVGLHGRTPVSMDLGLRFNYGAMAPWIEALDDGFVARLGAASVVLHSPVGVTLSDERASAEFTVHEGERFPFVLRFVHRGDPPEASFDAEAALGATQRFWRGWIGRFDDNRTRWPEAVRRSLITLKALVHHPSGSMVAAPTTSLPEVPGGTMNWDYRYCWLRDASFAVSCLVNAGYLDEATRWRDWLLRAVGGARDRLQIMYRVDGARYLDEREIAGLPGWNHALPIRAGNLASNQHQLDVYGEVLYAFDLGRRAGMAVTAQERVVSRRIVEHLARVWDIPGSGIWESRSTPRHYTYSKAMAWVGLDSYLGQYANGSDDKASTARLVELRREIRDGIFRDGWNEGCGHFTAYSGGQELDASLLLMPLVGVVPADDPRMAATIEAIGRDLNDAGLIRRTKRLVDGPNEGAFLPCSCWMANCLDLQGKHDEAAAQFERVLAVSNDVGLLSEEYDVPGRHLSGNFPQALTHLAVVNTALALSGPVLDRGGG